MSRRSSSKLSNKRVEIGSETVHILSSDGQSQDEADAGEIEEVDLKYVFLIHDLLEIA